MITWNSLKANLVIIGLTLTIGLHFKVKGKKLTYPKVEGREE